MGVFALGGAEAEIWSRLALYAMVGGYVGAFTANIGRLVALARRAKVAVVVALKMWRH